MNKTLYTEAQAKLGEALGTLEGLVRASCDEDCCIDASAVQDAVEEARTLFELALELHEATDKEADPRP